VDLTDKLIEIEMQLDDEINKLQIWELPFQTIISMLLLTIDNIDLKGNVDAAMDYASRLSYIYPLIKAKAAKASITTSTEAILKGGNVKYMQDVNFIIAYAHFCLLMPQVRKNMLCVTKIDGEDIFLEYPSDEVRKSESIDRLYGYLSLQIIMPYRDENKINQFVLSKVKNSENSITANDFILIKEIQEHYKKYFILVKPLPNEVFEQVTGLTYDEYHSFCATVRAFCDFFIRLGRAYYNSVDKKRNNEIDDHLMSEYFEWLVCCLNFKTLGWFAGISDISIKKLDNIISYYLQIYSDTTGEEFQEKSSCGEGYFPPFLLMEQSIIYSPQACKYLLTLNNILYSINKKQKRIFDEEISKHLEPTLICQLQYVFSFLKKVTIVKNVTFDGGELDLIVLSEVENVAICIQVKSTIAPDSSRTVERVTDRALEGIEQIKLFDSFESEVKQEIINTAFGKKLKNTKLINLLVVRSCAGSVKAWSFNDKYKIVNYSLLAWIIASKIESFNLNITAIKEEIGTAQDNLLKSGNVQEVYETLIIGKLKIKFPNLNSDIQPLFSMNIKSLKYMREFEDINC
jgi:hypothetical protein